MMSKIFRDGKWIEIEVAVVEAPKHPDDTEPTPPRPPSGDEDRPRWVAENVRYLEKLGIYRSRQKFKADHPELKGKSWHETA